MNIFIDPNETVDVDLNYVFDSNEEVCVLSNYDIELLDMTKEDLKNKIEEEDYIAGEEVPLNIFINDLSKYSKEDVKTANFKFRKPNFDDKNFILSNLNIDVESQNMNATQLLMYNSLKLKTLLKVGWAEDQEGKKHKITVNNIGSLSSSLASASATKLSEKIGI